MKSKVLLLLAGTAFFLLAGCSGPVEIGEAPPVAVCSSIINTKCIRCHYKTRICDALGTKSVGKWQRTIKFMIKQGAQLTEDEQNKVVACLVSLPRESDVVCE